MTGIAPPVHRSTTSLGDVLDDLGPTLFDVVSGVVDPSVPVGAVMIHDSNDALSIEPGDIVLAVGVGGRSLLELIAEADLRGAAALIMRREPDQDEQLLTTPTTRTPVLALVRGTSWAQVASMITYSIGREITAKVGREYEGEEDGGDLFTLANGIAALLNSPITIEDLHSRILAYSEDQRQTDRARQESVLERRINPEIVAALKKAGIYDEVYSSNRPVRIADPEMIRDLGLKSGRVAMRIQAEGEVLGSIWALTDGSLNAEREQALIDVTRPVALHLLRARSGGRGAARSRLKLLSALLAGGEKSRDAARRIGLFSSRSCVIAMAVDSTPLDRATAETELHRIGSAFALHMSMISPQSISAVMGSKLFALVPLHNAEGGTERAVEVVGDFMRRIGTRSRLHVGVSGMVTDPVRFAAARDDAERTLRAVRARAADDRRGPIGAFHDVQPEVLVQQLVDTISVEDWRLEGPLARVQEYDLRHESPFLQTLRVWLDSFGDVAVAAKQLHVHPNTLRYRVRRLVEITETDLADPEVRFGLMLQLRVFDVQREPAG